MVNIHEAKTHLSRLIERVESGEEVVIARAGRPVARLVPLARRTQPRALGTLRIARSENKTLVGTGLPYESDGNGSDEEACEGESS